MGTADDPDLSVLPAEESFDAATQTRAMSLPVSTSDEAALRALDPKCADPKSTVSRRIVALLAAESLAYKKDLLRRSTSMGLGNLVRCSLKAHMSPDSTLDAEEGNVPMLHLAVKVGATRALKALLAGGANIELTDKNRATALAEAARPPSRHVCSSFSTPGQSLIARHVASYPRPAPPHAASRMRCRACLALVACCLLSARWAAAAPQADANPLSFPRLPSPRPRVHLATFAGCSSAHRLPAFVAEARHSGFFDALHALTVADLAPAFLAAHGDFLSPSVRGCGYWTWKPQAVLQALLAAEDGDVVAYCDAGTSLHPENCGRFWDYVALAAAHPGKVVSFEMGHARQPHEDGWCKADAWRALNVTAPSPLLDAPQLHATYFFMVKTQEAVDLVQRWRDLAVAGGYHLIDDSPSLAPNSARFVEHRHDQALWSLLRKVTHSAVVVPDDAASGGAPVQSTRCRTGKESGCWVRYLKEAVWVWARDHVGSYERHAQRMARGRCPVGASMLAAHEHQRVGRLAGEAAAHHSEQQRTRVPAPT